MFAVAALSLYGICMVIVLRAPFRLTKTPQHVEELPEIPDWAAPDFWTQDRVDLQFRALTAPLDR